MEETEGAKLPKHGECTGDGVANVAEDVGLVTGACSACHAPFVYSYKTHTWIPEADFERELAANPPILAGI